MQVTVGIAARAIVQTFAGHHLHLPSHACDTFAIVAHRPQHAGDQGSVTVVVRRNCWCRSVQTVPAIKGINPHVCRKIFMRGANARIQHRHHDVAGRGQHVPGIRRINVCARPCRRSGRNCSSPTMSRPEIWDRSAGLHPHKPDNPARQIPPGRSLDIGRSDRHRFSFGHAENLQAADARLNVRSTSPFEPGENCSVPPDQSRPWAGSKSDRCDTPVVRIAQSADAVNQRKQTAATTANNQTTAGNRALWIHGMLKIPQVVENESGLCPQTAF